MKHKINMEKLKKNFYNEIAEIDKTPEEIKKITKPNFSCTGKRHFDNHHISDECYECIYFEDIKIYNIKNYDGCNIYENDSKKKRYVISIR